VKDVSTIIENLKVTSINSALAIDLKGQVCTDFVGTKHFQ